MAPLDTLVLEAEPAEVLLVELVELALLLESLLLETLLATLLADEAPALLPAEEEAPAVPAAPPPPPPPPPHAARAKNANATTPRRKSICVMSVSCQLLLLCMRPTSRNGRPDVGLFLTVTEFKPYGFSRPDKNCQKRVLWKIFCVFCK
ncbi:hypothetical protein GCM10025770_24860 [Viridibacterium curvum]|uniref:Secreted protein n=1 Tax=Viridibacterium curvum TaxID=1101404 RepID=A0ABP9QTB0_9RHOO